MKQWTDLHHPLYPTYSHLKGHCLTFIPWSRWILDSNWLRGVYKFLILDTSSGKSSSASQSQGNFLGRTGSWKSASTKAWQDSFLPFRQNIMQHATVSVIASSKFIVCIGLSELQARQEHTRATFENLCVNQCTLSFVEFGKILEIGTVLWQHSMS